MRKALLGLLAVIVVLALAYPGALDTFTAMGNSWHWLATSPYVLGY